MKICNKCDTEKELTEFFSNGYTPKGTKKYKPNCKPCTMSQTKAQYRKRLDEIVRSLGRLMECTNCGYDDNFAALQFHHITKEKNFEISSGTTRSVESLTKEIKLCVILCANCHAITHDRI